MPIPAQDESGERSGARGAADRGLVGQGLVSLQEGAADAALDGVHVGAGGFGPLGEVGVLEEEPGGVALHVRCCVWAPVAVENAVESGGRGAGEEGAEVGGKVVDANMLVLHVSPLPYVGKATGSNARHKLEAPFLLIVN